MSELIIDSHCHAGLDWFEPIEALLFQMDRHGVAASVLIQHTRGYDNSYLAECRQRFPDRIAFIGNVDPEAPDGPADLERWVGLGMQGYRLSLAHLEKLGDYRQVLGAAERMGIVVSVYGRLSDIASDNARDIIGSFPNLRFIIEHMAYPDRLEPSPYSTFGRALQLAELKNSYMKVHGFGEYLPRPEPMRHPPFDLDKVPPFIDMALEAFGAERLMFGTDSPPCSHREGYANVLRYVGQYLSRFSPADRRAILSGTALSLFSFTGLCTDSL
jgi:L-fuconolactonase